MTTPRWYMVNRDGMATLCTSKKDAEKEARDMDMAWPHMGPHRAVQLVDAADVEALHTGYAAARLEIESLQARIKTMAEERADELVVAHLDGRMRAAHGQAPARADMQDAYVGAREDLAIWKRRALEAERDLRAERETASRLAAEINAINGPTHLGEPAPTAQPAPAAADFTTLGAAMRAIQQAIELIGEPADDHMHAVKRVLRGAVIVAEDSGELSAPAAGRCNGGGSYCGRNA